MTLLLGVPDRFSFSEGVPWEPLFLEGKFVSKVLNLYGGLSLQNKPMNNRENEKALFRRNMYYFFCSETFSGLSFSAGMKNMGHHSRKNRFPRLSIEIDGFVL